MKRSKRAAWRARFLKAIEMPFRKTWSGWQINAFNRGIVTIVAAISTFLLGLIVMHALLLIYIREAVLTNWLELASGAFFVSIILICAIVYRLLYYQAYALKETPVVQNNIIESRGITWQLLYKDLSMGRDISDPNIVENNQKVVACYTAEFLFNALVNPRTVFMRISEHISPDPKLLECTIDYEIVAPIQRNVRICGINDYPTRTGDAISCYLLVPVSFLKREDLAVQQDITNNGDVRFPRVTQRDLANYIVELIESYPFQKGSLKKCSLWANETRQMLAKYLNSTEANDPTEVPHSVYDCLLSLCGSKTDLSFASKICYMLAGLCAVTPVCINVHTVALCNTNYEDNQLLTPGVADSFPQRVFSLRYTQAIESPRKPGNVIPNSKNNFFISLLNKVLAFLGQRNDTVYYSLARAGRSESYHLYLEGPEGTYYSRGSLMLDNPLYNVPAPTATYIEMQKRYGQRQAHVYIRNGHRMSNVLFMFRYKKVPLDTYHVAFAASFLCTVVLAVSAFTSLATLVPGVDAQRFSGLSVPAMMLAVATAIGPWVYNRASEGRGDSLGVEIAVLILTGCSGLGILLFFTAIGLSSANNFINWAWSAVIALMVVNSAFTGFVSYLHSNLYHRLKNKREPKDRKIDILYPKKSNVQFDHRLKARLDTPQGRYVDNAYRLWTNALRECREAAYVQVPDDSVRSDDV